MRDHATRLDKLEETRRGSLQVSTRLVLLTGEHGPTAEQQAQADAARDQGREVFTIVIAAREGGAPCVAC